MHICIVPSQALCSIGEKRERHKVTPSQQIAGARDDSRTSILLLVRPHHGTSDHTSFIRIKRWYFSKSPILSFSLSRPGRLLPYGAQPHPFECESPPVSSLCQLLSSCVSWPFGLQSPKREAFLRPSPRPPLVERPHWPGFPRLPPSPLLPRRPSRPGNRCHPRDGTHTQAARKEVGVPWIRRISLIHVSLMGACIGSAQSQ